MLRNDVPVICDRLQKLQRDRKFVIAMEVQATNRSCAHIVGALGVSVDAPERDRKAAWERARRIVNIAIGTRKVRKDGTVDIVHKPQAEEDHLIASREDSNLTMTCHAIQPILARRAELESEMERLAAELPVAESFITETPGFNLLGLAVIIGETGDLSNYATKRRLWRRLGLGMAQGHEAKAYSTWRKTGGLNAEQWTIAGYSPRRLGQIVGVVTVPLFMKKANSKYGRIYEARRQHTMKTHPEWYHDKNGKPKLSAKGEPSSAHGMADAKRVMTKALLADLLGAWRQSESPMNAVSPLAVSMPHPELTA